MKNAAGMKKACPIIDAVLEGSGELHLTEDEHAALLSFLALHRQMDDLERLHLYIRGHTDAFSYLKRIGAL